MKSSNLAGRVRASLIALPEPYANIKAVIPPLPPDILIPGDMGLHLQAQRALGMINGFVRGLPGRRFLATRLLERQEAVHSSAIEGTYATLSDLLALEDTEEGEEGAKAQQVRHYAIILGEAMQEVREGGATALSRGILRRLHMAVMEADPKAEAWRGKLRKIPVRIGGISFETATFVPPPPTHLVACLSGHFRWLRNDEIRFKNSAIARIACAHAHFEAIHPFHDGNGRVGRLLMALTLAAEGEEPLYLSPYIDANRAAYYAALRAAQQRDDWGAIIDFFSQAVIATVEESLRVHETLIGLIADWRQLFDPRPGVVLDRLLDLLPEYPSLTIKLAAEKLGVSYPAAAQAIETLQGAQILTERTGFARNRRFVAEQIVGLFQREE
jgi:Fic family protein